METYSGSDCINKKPLKKCGKPIYYIQDEIRGIRDAKNLIKRGEYYIEKYKKWENGLDV